MLFEKDDMGEIDSVGNELGYLFFGLADGDDPKENA